MNTAIHSSIESCTLDAAVARLIRLDYVPEGLSMLEMTAAFLEVAEVDYENAQQVSEDSERLACIANGLEARHQLAQHLLQGLELEAQRQDSELVCAGHATDGKALYDFSSIAAWAEGTYGISSNVPVHATSAVDTSSTPLDWSQVTIKLYAANRLGVKLGAGNFRSMAYQDIGLMGRRKNDPNMLGGLLMCLAIGKRYPTTSRPTGAEKAKLSKLRSILVRITGIDGDPFFPITPDRGWTPRFTIIDDTRNAENRAKERVVFEEYDDTRNYEREDDEAQRWLDENE